MSHRPAHDDPEHQSEEACTPSFWLSRAGIYLVVALGLGGLLLGYEHRIHIFASNWILWLPLLICIGMHFFTHGGHADHGSGGDRS